MVTATSFIYDGVSCEDFDLMIYYIGDPGTVEETVWSSDIHETRVPKRQDPLHYGVSTNSSLSFDMTVGSKTYIDRETEEQILDWLTSHNTYKWLEIEQDDMSDWRYKALFKDVQVVSVNGMPFAFKCTVVLDSQFAYEHPTKATYRVENGKIVSSVGNTADTVSFLNSSSYQGYYYPKMSIKLDAGSNRFVIINQTDKERTFEVNIPEDYATNDGSDSPTLYVDNKNQIITCNSDNVNIYKLFGDEAGNHYFFRLTKGENELKFEGSGTITFECEFMRKVGM